MAARTRAKSRSRRAKSTKRALTRKVTRNAALSYQKTVPNRRGVTALSEINGPDAYRRRYRATAELLSRGRRGASARRGGNAMAKTYTPGQRRAMKKMTPKRRSAFKRMLARAPRIETIRPGRKKTTARSAKPNRRGSAKKKTTRRARPNRALVPSAAAQKAFEKGHARIFSKRPTKASFVAAQMRKGRTKKQADATWRVTYGRKRAAAAKKRARKPRTYGKGKYRALKARVGTTSRRTYMYRTPKGRVRHIPEHAVLGYPSARALKLARQKPKGEAAYQKKKAALERRRSAAATRSAARIRAGKGIFTPNPGEEVLSYEEWKEMYNPNKKRARKKAKAKKKTKAELHRIRVRAGKKAAATKKRKKAKRSAAAKKGSRKRTTRKAAPKRRTAKRKGTRKRKGGQTAKQRAASLRNLRKARAARKKGGARKRTTRRAAPKRKTTRKKGVRRARSMSITLRPNASRAQIAAARRNIRKAQAARWKRNTAMRYTANPAEAYVEDLKGAVKLGAIVVTGYMAHRALSKVLNDYVLSRVGFFQSGTAARWRDVIAGILVAAAGVPLAVKVVPRESAAAGAGMAASLLHQLVVTALTEAGQPGAVAYLSAYPDASSPAWRGMGSYYTFRPRQTYPTAGMGEFYSLTPGLQTQQLTQAAAGFQPMQAAAGMGALVTQAAAGQGEYLVYGAEGFGDNYEQIPASPVPMMVDDGVQPNLYSAEQELNVMEAAAGVGQSDIPYQQTVNPLQLEVPIGDEPRGSRSGIFSGRGGIFG